MYWTTDLGGHHSRLPAVSLARNGAVTLAERPGISTAGAELHGLPMRLERPEGHGGFE